MSLSTIFTTPIWPILRSRIKSNEHRLWTTTIFVSPEILGSDSGRVEGQAGAEGKKAESPEKADQMTENWKRTIAREWLYAVGGLIGAALLMVILAVVWGDTIADMRNFPPFLPSVLLIFLGFQMLRSILWAIRTIRK